MDSRAELDEQLRLWWDAFCADRHPYCNDGATPGVRTKLTDRDAGGFLRGIKVGLFSFDRGVADSPLFRLEDGSPARDIIFDRRGTRAEMVVQFAAAAELVLDFGWPIQQVDIESPNIGDVGPWALDLLVFDAAHEHCILAGEAKKTAVSMQRAVDGIRRCGGVGGVGPGHSRTDHKKCQALLAFRPLLFLAIAPGRRSLFPLTVQGNAFMLGDGSVELPSRTG